MLFRNKYFFIFVAVLNFVTIISVIGILSQKSNKNFAQSFADFKQHIRSGVLGEATEIKTIFGSTITPSPTPLPSATPTVTPTPTPIEHTTTILNLPTEIPEGGVATFTWFVDGLGATIKTTTVYFSTTSTPGKLAKMTAPEDTAYSGHVKDFISGEYKIPLQFVGNATISQPGGYYARAYAYIDGKHIWSPERSFIVNKIPRNEIHVVDYLKQVKKGENGVFTWEVTGPPNITTYTTIVIGRDSKPGRLEKNVDIAHTPYLVLVKDFTNGTYNVPLRFVGNALMQESGTYYFRAYAWIFGRNVWSDEHTITVE